MLETSHKNNKHFQLFIITTTMKYKQRSLNYQ